MFTELFGKRPAPIFTNPFELEFSFHPLRLSARRSDYVVVDIILKNISSQEQLTSLIVSLPRGLGFEPTGLNQQREIRLGHLPPGEEKRFKLSIYSSQRTAPGEYEVKLFAASHYRNYGYLINELRKIFVLRAV